MGPRLLSPNGSFFWKAIRTFQPIFHSAVSYTINSGSKTSFWYDAWAGQPLILTASPPVRNRAISVRAARASFHNLIQSPLSLQQHEAHQKILATAPSDISDEITWRLSPSGQFTTSSIYQVLSQGGKTDSPVSYLWRAKVTPSMALFTFFLLHNKLLTHEVMTKRQIPHVPGCVMCHNHPTETSMHLFFECTYASSIWNALTSSTGYNMLTLGQSPLQTFLASTPASPSKRLRWLPHFIAATFFLWKERNNRIFENAQMLHHQLAHKIILEAALCLKHC